MRLPLAWMLVSTIIICQIVLIETRYWYRDDHKDLSAARHRHRHSQHETTPRWKHNARRSPWNEDDDASYDDETWSNEEEDYDDFYSSRKRNDYRHPTRLHQSSYRWQHHRQEEASDRRRGNPWFDERNRRGYRGRNRVYRKGPHSRIRSEGGLVNDNENCDSPLHRRYHAQEDKTDRSSRRWNASRKQKIDRDRDWRMRVEDEEEEEDRRRKTYSDYISEQEELRPEIWRKRFRGNLTIASTTARNDIWDKFENSKKKSRRHDDEDYYAYDDEVNKDDEDTLWKGEDNEEDVEEDEEYDDNEDDNDLSEKDEKPPLKTFNDIIERLTSGDSTTSRSHIKRDSRNLEIAKYLKRDVYGNLRYEPRNISEQGHNPFQSTSTASTPKRVILKKEMASIRAENISSLHSMVTRKNQSISDNRKSLDMKKSNQSLTQTKNLDSDYEEYVNGDDNEKEGDLGRADLDDDPTMQADFTNTDYVLEDHDEDEEEELSLNARVTTTTTTTTTTVKPLQYNYRDLRAYDSSTGPQYNGYQSKNEYPPMSAHSVHKWQTLGTRESVKETRGNMQQYNKSGKTAEIREALQHAIKVSREGSCQWPRARVIPVRDVYPSSSTTYIPHCAILHRCSDDTGCCRSEALTCVPKHSHRVELYFYATSVEGTNVVEKLSFYNHTECECRERREYVTLSDKPSEHRFYGHQSPSPPPQNIRRPPQRKLCRCPSEFTPRITSKGECHCNCFDNDEDCIRARRGKVYFSLTDRLCIQNEVCATPTCEFGQYMKFQGKCPRRRDRFDTIANYHTNYNHRFHRS